MRAITITLTVFAFLIGGYVFWWNTVADAALKQVEIWKKEQTAYGYAISHKPIITSGFPYRVKLEAHSLKVTKLQSDDSDEFETTIPDIWVIAQPWKPSHIVFGSSGTSEHTWIKNNVRDTVSILPGTALGSATFTSNGELKTLAIDINNAKIKSDVYGPASAKRLQLHSRVTSMPKISEGTDAPTSKIDTPAWQIAIRADTIKFENSANLPLGDTITKAAFSMLIEGHFSDFKNTDAITKWRDNGGILDVQDMNLIWGKTQLSGNGTLTLDEQNYPLGAFSSKITGFNELLALLGKSKNIDKQSLRTAAMALNLISKEDENGSRYLEIPVSLQDRAVFAGPFKLLGTTPLF